LTGSDKLQPTTGAPGFLDRVEEKLLCLMLATMIILACVQIFLRFVFAGGLLWIDPLLRYLVLWCGLIGAVSATSQGKHIALDITDNRLPPAIAPWLTFLVYLFCTLAAAGLTWAGLLFLRGEIASGGQGPLALPLWFWNGIFPLAFGLITMKYFLLFIRQTRTILTLSKAASNGQG
jgi:TRAP-type C4-dicarboxylate transport system permease small subunit